ncbi:MAG: GNAT family N-acetyltransferase [Chloroflexi bacterium]|nr:GNAT family N-acetyltransferase [Chloroflexota bacterium]
MQLTVIHTIEEFEAIAAEWNRILSHSASHVPFLRSEYLSAWWRTRGGGEWPHAALYVVLARDEAGELLAAAPLFLAANPQGEQALMLLGSIEISDYLDILACPAHLDDFLHLLFEYLDSPAAPPWDALDWYNLLDDSPTLPALQAAAERRGWTFAQERLQHCPCIPLPGDWETYLAGIDKKQRHEIRRKMRRAEEGGAQVHWYIAADEAALDAEIDDFLRLMAFDAEKQAFLTEVMRTQMRSAVWAAFRAGWLQLAFLEVDGKKAAGYLNFDYHDHIWVYNSGIDTSYSALSPGWVLLGRLLQWANQNQRKAFDFMRGDEEYKYRFGGVDRFVVRAAVRQPTLSD